MMILSLLLSVALADSSILDVMRKYMEYASIPIPLPTAAQVAKLEKGERVKMMLSGGADAPDGALVLAVSALPRKQLWLGSADSHGEEHGLFSYHLPRLGGEMFRWYGLLDLPRPFSDRHFLIRTVVNKRLPAAHPGMWERSWTLEDGGQETMRQLVAAGKVKGMDQDRFDKAIYVPSNRGAWIFLDLPDGRTLFGYHAASSLGGEIPEGLVTRYIFWGLDEITRNVFERAATMPEHYRGSHRAFEGGDGQKIPYYP